jgi:DNA replication protein DnaC
VTCSFPAQRDAGKTYLACALAQAAIRRGHKALYWRTPRLLDELRLAHADGRAAQLMANWTRTDVLILDDLGLRPLTAAQAADLLEVIEDRHQRRSTIITSQLPINTWHDNLGEPTLADAICDRILHTAYRIELRGESLRKPQPPPPPTRQAITPKPPQHTSDQPKTR